MRVIFLLCAALLTLSVATADPLAEMTPGPAEETASVQQNKAGEGQRGKLLHRIAGRMSEWQVGGVTVPPHHYAPTNWHGYGPRYFILINSPMAWIDAEKHCWIYGANLASIHDPWERDFILKLITADGYYGPAWIGGSDGVRSRDWLWSDGSVFDAESWANVQPIDWKRWKKCLTINPQESPNNHHCEEKLPFICGTTLHEQF